MNPEYKKFAKINSIGGKSYLWIADDHFLLVKKNGYFIEQYRRYFFDDIKYILVMKTKIAFLIYAIFAVISILMGLLSLYSYFFLKGENMEYFFGFLFVIFFALTLY